MEENVFCPLCGHRIDDDDSTEIYNDELCHRSCAWDDYDNAIPDTDFGDN